MSDTTNSEDTDWGPSHSWRTMAEMQCSGCTLLLSMQQLVVLCKLQQIVLGPNRHSVASRAYAFKFVVFRL